ncbi:L-ornithine 5-monooxygenase [Pseudomonas aeruginosa]|nr:L-ornithine 5-monooxygenase [Pseudomonas aeruginosa]
MQCGSWVPPLAFSVMGGWTKEPSVPARYLCSGTRVKKVLQRCRRGTPQGCTALGNGSGGRRHCVARKIVAHCFNARKGVFPGMGFDRHPVQGKVTGTSRRIRLHGVRTFRCFARIGVLSAGCRHPAFPP